MAKPLTEHKSTIKGKKGKARNQDADFEPVQSSELQPVSGGNVRRIVFEGREATFREVPEPHHREYIPRHSAPMHDIEFEIDNLGRIRRGEPPRRQVEPTPTETVYRAGTGSVRRAYEPTSYGRKRVLYTTTKRGEATEQKRFSSSDVDKIIAGVSLEPEVEVHREVKTRFVKRKRKVVEKVPVEAKPKKAKAKKGAKERKTAKKDKLVEATFEPVDDKEYEPQCEAVTKDGGQCRNSSRHGSKYCGAHKGYRPRSMEDVLTDRDTAPHVKDAEDTLPGKTGTGDGELQPQCAAYAKSGDQCRNSSRQGSKYCGSHKGYRAPTKEQLRQRMDTKPRWSKAKDTAPNLK